MQVFQLKQLWQMDSWCLILLIGMNGRNLRQTMQTLEHGSRRYSQFQVSSRLIHFGRLRSLLSLLQSSPFGARTMSRILCVFLLIATCLAQSSPSAKQKVLWQKLQLKIDQIDQNLDGVMGVAIEDLTDGEHYFLRED